MAHWVPTDRVRGGYTPVKSQQDKEYSGTSIHTKSSLTPASYSNPSGIVTPSMTSLRPMPPIQDPVILQPSPPPVQTQPSTTVTTSTTNDVDVSLNTNRRGTVTGATVTQTTTVTTDTSTRYNMGIIDVSIIPYMRRLDIDFNVVGLRPNRRVYFFFDKDEVTKYISRSNMIRLRDPATPRPPGANPNWPFHNIRDEVTHPRSEQIVSNAAFGFSTSGRMPNWRGFERTGRRRARVVRRTRSRNPDRSRGNVTIFTTGTLDPIGPNFTIRTNITGVSGNVTEVNIRTGPINFLLNRSNNFSSNSVFLSPFCGFRFMANNYWGTDGSNVITFLTHNNRGISRKIIGYDNVSYRLSLSREDNDATVGLPGFPRFPTNNEIRRDGSHLGQPTITIGQFDDVHFAETGEIQGVYKTDDEGSFHGTFHCPGGIFLTGERIFSVIDDRLNLKGNATTYAEYKFVSSGLKQITQDYVVNIRDTDTTIRRTTVLPPPPPPPPPNPPSIGGGGDGPESSPPDPIAQTFFVEPDEYPEGMFVSSVDLFFNNKDESLPVIVEIRPTVNGYPDSNFIIPGSTITKPADDVVITTLPNTSNASTKTNFRFGNPIYLPPGEYALVVWSISLEYEIWASELGQQVVGTKSYVSEQPHLGSMFKAQNSTAWTATQLEDMMFVINKAQFEPSGTVYFYSKSPSETANTPVDELYINSEQTILKGTSIAYQFSDNSSNIFEPFQTGVVHVPTTGGRIQYPANTDGYFKLSATLTTDNPDISPIIYHDGFATFAKQNFIDNADLNFTNFTILNSGSGYTPNANIALVFSGSGNGDAEIYAQSNSTGHITGVYIANPGSGFLEDASVTLNTLTGSGCQIKLSSELDPVGGTSVCKYISRTVTLNDGFESADMRVILTAYKPRGTGIHVYYKVKNGDDPESFDDKPYFKMIQKEYLTEFSRDTKDYLELEFTPFGEDEDAFRDISYSSGGATYTTFNQFAIKVVLTTDDTTYYPVLRNLRAVALPSNEV